MSELEAIQLLALDAVRDQLQAALAAICSLDPDVAVPLLLDARRHVRQALAAVDTFEDQVLEKGNP